MKIQNKRLCKLGPSGRGFYIENTYMTDEQIGNHFDLIITPTSIRSRILNLMEDGSTWNISDLATEVSIVNQDYGSVVDFVESILDTVPEITKVSDLEYWMSRKS